MSINTVVLTGRATETPAIKYTQSEKAYTKFTLAVNRRYNRDETDFINIVAWDKKAELVSQYVKKGAMVGITGSIRARSYEDDNGIKRKITEILVDNLEFLEPKKAGSSSEEASAPKPESAPADEEFPFS